MVAARAHEAHLRGHEGRWIFSLQCPSDQRFAAAIAVHVGRVKKRHPQVVGLLERRQGLPVFCGTVVVPADGKSPKPDLRYLDTGRSQLSVVHVLASSFFIPRGRSRTGSRMSYAVTSGRKRGIFPGGIFAIKPGHK